MMMLLVDGGKIIDYTAEEGYYTIKNDAAPSMFNGTLKVQLLKLLTDSNLAASHRRNNKFLYQSPRNKGNQIRYKRAVELL